MRLSVNPLYDRVGEALEAVEHGLYGLYAARFSPPIRIGTGARGSRLEAELLEVVETPLMCDRLPQPTLP